MDSRSQQTITHWIGSGQPQVVLSMIELKRFRVASTPTNIFLEFDEIGVQLVCGLKINLKGLFVWKKLFSYNIELNLAEYDLALSHFHPGIF